MDPLPADAAPPRRPLATRVLLSTLKWGILVAALLGTAGITGYLFMKRTVRGGEVEVPALEGKSLSEAEASVKTAGLTVEKSGERSDPRVEAGRIVVQDPPGGARLKRNRKVRVILDRRKDESRNPPQIAHRLRTHGAVVIREP